MPVDLENEHVCHFPGCTQDFTRKSDLFRHYPTHSPHEQWEYDCPYEDCDFRANQKGGVTVHVNGFHKKLRLACPEPGCDKTYSDPSSLCRHRKDIHGAPGRAKALRGRASRCPTGSSKTRRRRPRKPSTSQGSSSAPYVWFNYIPESGSYKTIQYEHQEAYDANHPGAGQTGVGTSLDVVEPRPSCVNAQQQPTIPPGFPAQEASAGFQRGQPCQYRDGTYSYSIGLSPVRKQQLETMEAENEAHIPFKFLFPRADHVPSSLNDIRSSEYPRPNLRMLF